MPPPVSPDQYTRSEPTNDRGCRNGKMRATRMMKAATPAWRCEFAAEADPAKDPASTTRLLSDRTSFGTNLDNTEAG